MKNLHAALIILIIIFAGIALTQGSISAAPGDIIPVCDPSNNSGTDASNSAVCQDVNEQDGNANPVIGIISSAVRVVSYVAGAAAVILTILSAIRFITSSGDSGKVSQAKSALIYALVGVVITVLAQAIISFVLNKV